MSIIILDEKLCYLHPEGGEPVDISDLAGMIFTPYIYGVIYIHNNNLVVRDCTLKQDYIQGSIEDHGFVPKKIYVDDDLKLVVIDIDRNIWIHLIDDIKSVKTNLSFVNSGVKAEKNFIFSTERFSSNIYNGDKIYSITRENLKIIGQKSEQFLAPLLMYGLYIDTNYNNRYIRDCSRHSKNIKIYESNSDSHNIKLFINQVSIIFLINDCKSGLLSSLERGESIINVETNGKDVLLKKKTSGGKIITVVTNINSCRVVRNDTKLYYPNKKRTKSAANL